MHFSESEANGNVLTITVVGNDKDTVQKQMNYLSDLLESVVRKK